MQLKPSSSNISARLWVPGLVRSLFLQQIGFWAYCALSLGPARWGACTELTGRPSVERVEKPRKASVLPPEKCACIFVYNSRMFMAARFIIEKYWKPLQYSSVGEYLHPWQLISEMEYYVVRKRGGTRFRCNNVARSPKPPAERRKHSCQRIQMR